MASASREQNCREHYLRFATFALPDLFPLELLFFAEAFAPPEDLFPPVDLPEVERLSDVERDDVFADPFPFELLDFFAEVDLPPLLFAELVFPLLFFADMDLPLVFFPEDDEDDRDRADELEVLRFPPPVDRDLADLPRDADVPDVPERLDEVIVSAAAPIAPTAAPVAAPVSISPATSIALSTIASVVLGRLDLDDLPFDDEEPELELFAIM